MIYIFVIGIIALIVLLRKYIHSPQHIGSKGEARVASILAGLPSEYQVLNDVIIPTKYGTTQIDHIVFSPYGIFVIETKNYSGWIFGDEKSEQWKQTFRTKSSFFKNPVKQNWGHIYALAELLNISKRNFISIIVFANFSDLKVSSSIPVIQMKHLKKHILLYGNRCLFPEEVSQYYKVIAASEINDKDAAKQHVENIHNKIAYENSELSQGLCPKCDGKLILRNGKYGAFYGCSNYPRCRYVHKTR